VTVVADASALLDLLLDVVPDAQRHHLTGDLAAPDLVFPEVASGLARLCRRGLLDRPTATLLLEELTVAPIEITPTRELVGRAFELSERISPYDACYVALAEAAGAPLVTADRRLAGAPGLPVPVVVL